MTGSGCSGTGVDGGEINNSPAGCGLEGHSDGVVCLSDRAGLSTCMMAGELSKSSGPFPIHISLRTEEGIRAHT
jgi:hypothetical protein